MNELDPKQEETIVRIEKKLKESEVALAKEKAAKKSSVMLDRKQAKELLIKTQNIDTSIAGVRTDPEMDEVIDGVKYYFLMSMPSPKALLPMPIG
ncbi:hypothetical protein V7139_00610 [Neobacillus drentensis]|uniref:hypothetical protein n=1 Tax=Neobacillus drentensis TaxID=220684 RepID=UPI003000AD30